MFTVRSVPAVSGFTRAPQLLSNIRDRQINDVWYNGAHLFLSLDNRKYVHTYDIKSDKLTQAEAESCCLDRLDLLSPLNTVIHNIQNRTDCVLLVYDNGRVELCIYNSDYNGWPKQCHTDFTICTSPSSKVVSTLCSGSWLYWCEEDSDQDGLLIYRVCKRQLPRGPVENWNSERISDASVLVKQCGPVDFYKVSDSVIIWPRLPAPPGLVIVHPSKGRHLEVVFLGTGYRLQHSLTSGAPLDYNDTAQITAVVWMKPNGFYEDLIGRAYDASLAQLYIVGRDGSVNGVDIELRRVCNLRLGDLEQFDPGLHWQSFYGFLAVYLPSSGPRTTEQLRIYYARTGVCIQTINLPASIYAPLVNTWTTEGPIHYFGFFTKERICIINMCDADAYMMLRDGNSVKTANTSQRLMEKTYQICTGVTETPSEVQEKLSKSFLQDSQLQNPSLIIAALHETTGTGRLSPTSSDDVNAAILNHYGCQGNSSVNAEIGPLIEEYLSLEEISSQELIANNMENEKVTVTPSLHDELMVVMTTDHHGDPASRLAELERLSLEHPEETLHFLYAFLRIGAVDDGELADDKLSERWSEFCSEADVYDVTDHVSGEARVACVPALHVLVRLVLVQKPAELSAVLEQAKSRLEQCDLYDRVLTMLPDSSLSRDAEAGVDATVHVVKHSRSECRHAHCVQLLLAHARYEEAINYVREHEYHDSLHHELYNIVFTHILKVGRLGAYSNSLASITPKDCRPLFLLDHMINYYKASGQSQSSSLSSVLCQRDDQTPIQDLRPLLEKIFQTTPTV